MTTVKEIYDFFDSFAPFSTQDSFDNSGLLVGNANEVVRKIAVCLDITNEIVQEASELGANLIISHHPVIFHKLASVNSDGVVANLVKKNISAICIHTNLDVARGGISDIMLELLGFSGDEIFEVTDAVKKIGYGRIAKLDFPSEAKTVAEIAKKAFNCHVVRYYDSGKPIRRLAVISGAGCSEQSLELALQKDCDAVLSGDMKHSVFVEAKNKKLSVIDAGHFHTENIVCSMLVSMLTAGFKDIEAFIPYSNKDVCRYI